MDSTYTKAGYLTEPFKIFHLRDEHKLNIDFHYHDFHKILIHLHGNVSYCIEGRSYELKEHDIVLVNAGEVHKPILNDDSIYERIILYVSPQLIDDYVSKGYDLACCFKQAYANQSHVLRLAATKGSRLADTIKGLDSTLRETTEYANELYQKLLFLEFLIQLNRITLHGGIEYINTFSSNKKIVEILDFLNKNLTNRISIDELADKFYMSRYHLMHTFKEETGCARFIHHNKASAARPRYDSRRKQCVCRLRCLWIRKLFLIYPCIPQAIPFYPYKYIKASRYITGSF